MWKNNLIAFLIQVGISLSTYAFYSILSEQRFFEFGVYLLLPPYFFAYYLVGTFLNKQDNLLKDFISVSSVTIVGLFIWLGSVIYVATTTSGGFIIGPEIIWFFNVFYNAFSIFGVYIFFELTNSYPLMVTSLFIINFIPSLIMVYGMKDSKKKREESERLES